MSAMQIDLRVSGMRSVRDATRDLNLLASSMRNVASAQRSYSNGPGMGLMGSVAVANPAGGGGGNRGGSGGNSGPYARYGQAHVNLQNAVASGNPTTIADAQYRLHMASMSAQRAQNAMTAPTFGSKLQSLAYSTRFGGAGGAMPLVGKSLDLLGLGKMAGPIGVVIAGLIALGHAVVLLKDHMMAVGELRGTGGGSPSDTANAKRVAGIAGMDPVQLAGIANQMQDDYFTDPVKAAEYRRYGMQNPGYGPNKDPNSIGPALDVIKNALMDSDRDRSLRFLKNNGLEKYAPLIGNKELIDSTFRGAGSGLSDHEIANGYRLQGAVDQFWQYWNDAGAKALSGAMDTIARVLDMVNAMGPGVKYGPGGVFGPANKVAKENDVSNQQLKTLKSIETGVWKLSKSREFVGGGASLRGSIPSEWQHFNQSDLALYKQFLGLGAFGI